MAEGEKKTSSALILAGGKSSRFGINKALISYRGTSLIGHIIAQLELYFTEIIISANNPSEYSDYDLKVCADIFTDAGPLAGIHAGLKAAKNEYVFVTACDMPFVSAGLIAAMREEIKRAWPPAIVAARNGFIEPFHGFYSKSIIPDLETALSEKIGMFKFIKSVPHRTIECADDERMFFNINSPEDFSVFLDYHS